MTTSWTPECVDLPAATYYEDLVHERPTLSSSIANVLVTRSPLHAWYAHPRLNPNYRREEDKALDLGSAAHALLLERNHERIAIVDAPDWRTNAAKDARDEARAAGKIPLLPHVAEELAHLVDAVYRQLADHTADPSLLAEPGKPEQTLVWEEANGVVCRARPDWLFGYDPTIDGVVPGGLAIDDLKTTTASARADQVERRLLGTGAEVQAAFYLRGVQQVFGRKAMFRWLVVETNPPYALSVISPKPTLLELGWSKVQRAIALWGDCLATNDWPAYEPRVWYADAPPWELERWFATQEVDT